MRVKDNREKIFSIPPHTWELHDTINIMLGDLHFLFISIDKVYSLSIKLLNLLEDTAAASSLSHSEQRMNLKHLRNNLEHMDEKLTTEDQKYKKPWYAASEYHNWFSSQWGSISDNSIKLGNGSFILDESSFSQLWDTYDNILCILQKKYISVNKELVDRIFDGLKGPEWR